MKNIAIIVPTRSRPSNIQRLHEQWFKVIDSSVSTECIVVIDEDDEKNYPRLERFQYIVVKSNGERGVVYPLNQAALQVCNEYEYLGFWGDDHYPLTNKWNSIMYNALKERGPCAMVYGNDRNQGIRLPTQIIMDSLIVKKFGYMGHPTFKHLYVDDFWKYVGTYIGSLIYLDNVIIEHLHYSINKAPLDTLYIINDSPQSYEYGKKILDSVINNKEFIDKLVWLKNQYLMSH